MSTSEKSVKVWDPIVRIGHWTLVIAFFTAYLTEDEFMTQHIWAGYVVASVVLFRIIWGIIGSQHARFSDFVYRPSVVLGYLKSLAQRNPRHYLGHNPAGGAMVITLLTSLCITVYSGMALYAVEENAGPLASIYGQAQMLKGQSAEYARKDDEKIEQEEAAAEISRDTQENTSIGGTGMLSKDQGAHNQPAVNNEQDEEFWEGLHEFFANFTLLLVAVHVGGVLLSSHLEKVNLVKAMWTGRKKLP
jgi:cytochrome b